jgi:hypothetical protein
VMTSLKDYGSYLGCEAASWKNHVHRHTFLSAPMIFSLRNRTFFIRYVCTRPTELKLQQHIKY